MSHGVVVVAVNADVDQSELCGLALLLNADYVLIIFSAGFQLGDRAVLLVILIASQLVL